MKKSPAAGAEPGRSALSLGREKRRLIRASLKKVGPVSAKIFKRTIFVCQAYMARCGVYKNGPIPIMKELKSLLRHFSKSQKLIDDLSYQAGLEIYHLLPEIFLFQEFNKLKIIPELSRVIQSLKLGKGRPTEFVRDLLLSDLAEIYHEITGHEPKYPYRSHYQDSAYGKFFGFTSGIITMVDNRKPNTTTLISAIRRIIDVRRKGAKTIL